MMGLKESLTVKLLQCQLNILESFCSDLDSVFLLRRVRGAWMMMLFFWNVSKIVLGMLWLWRHTEQVCYSLALSCTTKRP